MAWINGRRVSILMREFGFGYCLLSNFMTELELRRTEVKEYIEESMRTIVVADMPFDEKTALHRELAERK